MIRNFDTNSQTYQRNDDSISTNLTQKLTPLDGTSKESMKFNKNLTQALKSFPCLEL